MRRSNDRPAGARPRLLLASLLGAFGVLACGDGPTAAVVDAPDAALSVSTSAPKGPRGNSRNAKLCHKEGWRDLVTSNGEPFLSEEACVAYAAQGGTLLLAQTITFDALTDRAFGDADFDVSATASSGLPVTFSASGACTVGGATVTLTGAGSCTITASQPGDETWFAAPEVERSFAVARGDQTVAFTSANPSPVNVGSTYQPTGTATSGLPATFSIDAASTGCSLTGGLVSFTSTGTCLVNVDQAGDADYNPAPRVQQAIDARLACIADDASLRAAAASGGTHAFCTEGVTVLLTGGQVTVSTTLVLNAVGTGNAVIDAQAASRVFEVVAPGQLTLNNVTVTNGREAAAGTGGGIHVGPSGAVLVLNGTSTVTGNTAPTGAGLYIGNSGSSVTLNDAATVSNNVAAQLGTSFGPSAGGVYLNYSSALTLNGTSLITGNFVADPSLSARGAGVVSNAGTLQLNGSSGITNNGSTATALGGGVYFVNGGSLTLSASARITGNVAQAGGGIYRIDNGGGTITGVTSTNVTGNVPDNCASSFASPAVPGCVN